MTFIEDLMYDSVLVYPETPTLPELLRLRIPERIGHNYMPFGVFLLQDDHGSMMANIEHENNTNPQKIIHQILRMWLQGRGVPVTWSSLIRVLRDCELNTLAALIGQAIIKGIILL